MLCNMRPQPQHVSPGVEYLGHLVPGFLELQVVPGCRFVQHNSLNHHARETGPYSMCSVILLPVILDHNGNQHRVLWNVQDLFVKLEIRHVFPLSRLLYVVLLVGLMCESQFVRQESPPTSMKPANLPAPPISIKPRGSSRTERLQKGQPCPVRLSACCRAK